MNEEEDPPPVDEDPQPGDLVIHLDEGSRPLIYTEGPHDDRT